MKKKIINNPVYQDLISLNLVNYKNLYLINDKTRDFKDLPVYIDKKSNIIFLSKYKKNISYYKKKKTNRRKVGNKSFSLFKNQKIKTLNLSDQKRRVRQYWKTFKNKKILDFGCGDGKFLSILKKFTKDAYGIELNKYHINKLKNKIKIFDNLEEINFKFDYITMFHVLEHLPKQILILKELKKKLKKNGKLIIEVPHANDFLIKTNLSEFKNFTFWSEHLILHTENSLKKFLNKAGFKKIKIKFFQRYNFANHLGWFLDKKPGGHLNYKNYQDKKLIECYENFLNKTKMTDTLIAEASNF